MAVSNRVQTITQDRILPKIVDNLLSDNFVTYRFIGNGKKWSGETLKRPIKLSKNTQGGSFSGLDAHNTGTVDTRKTMSYDLRGYTIPVAVPGMDKVLNQGESKVIDLIKAELDSTYMDALDDIGSMAYLDGTGNSNKDFLGFDALNDDGTSVDSIGGLSRTTYTALQGERTASGGTLTLPKLATLHTAISSGSAGNQRPTIIISSETEWNLYEQLLTPMVRANYQATGYPSVTRRSRGVVAGSELKAGAGYTSLVYRGVPWVGDEKAPAGTIWMNNENNLDWYGAKDPDLKQISLGSSTHDGVYNDAPSDSTGLQWTGFMRPINQYGEVGHLYLLGNMTTFQPRRHGRLTGVTTV